MDNGTAKEKFDAIIKDIDKEYEELQKEKRMKEFHDLKLASRKRKGQEQGED